MKKSSIILSTTLSLLLFAGCGDSNTQTTENQPAVPEVSTQVNTVPVATFEAFSISKDVRYDGQLTATDADGDMLQYVIVTQPSHGTVMMHDNGCFTYTPDNGYEGKDTFSYKASDDLSSCALKTVTVDVKAPTIQVPAAPSNLTVTALSTTQLKLHWSDNADNEEGYVIYRDGNPICTTQANATEMVVKCGLEAGKTYAFEVKAKNEAGTSIPATAEGTTKDVTTAPSAPTNLKAKAVDKTSLRLEWKDNADNESGYEIYQDGVKIKTISSGCSCTVVSNLKSCKHYDFQVKAINKIGSSSSNTLSVDTLCDVVMPTNTAPTATAQSVTLDEDTSKAITLVGTDAEGDALTYSIVTPPSHGTYIDGVYTPTANYFGSDSFTFKANDGKVDSVPATISITITDVAEPNTPPTANSQSVTLDEDTTKAITLSGNDVEGDTLTYTVVTPASHGTYTNGVYTPTANYFGSDSFTFKANDGKVDSVPATVSITVTSVNDAPVVDAGADANITEGDSYTPSPISSDSDGTIASTVWSEGATTLTFPKTDFSVGAHTLTVTSTDNEGATATDTLTLTVNPKPVTCKPLPKTGQTTVYTNFDDGHYQKGAEVDPRFVRDSTKEIVKDNVTGLTWQDDNDAKTLLKTWQEAIDYCDASTLGSYTDWRLPNIEELVYITDKGRVNPAIDPVFENVSSSVYWSSTTYVGYTSYAWSVNFHNGYDGGNVKTNGNYVRCVRDGQ